MKRFKQMIAGVSLVLGLTVIGLASLRTFHPNTHPQDREEAIAAFALLGIPPTALGIWLAWGLRQQHKSEEQRLAQAQEQLFLELLQTQGGQLTLIQFAAAAKMPLDQAKLFLDQKAGLLNASFDVTDAGGVVYQFPL
jgi:cadmium resistance protein CadD (predicted permease)